MKYTRLIARLDIKGPNLVKGIHLEGLRVLGKPEEFAKSYYDKGIDEIIYQDTVASLYQRNSLLNIIKKTSQSIFVPLTVGGGIRTLNDIKDALRSGADKVAINTAAINNPGFVRKASQTFGSSTIVIAIEASKNLDNDSYSVYTDNGREYTGIDALSWAKECENKGAGELLVTSIDSEGTGNGFDLELTQLIASNVNIPVIAHGGASRVSHICDVIQKCEVDAVALSSIIHYGEIQSEKNNLIINNNEGNTEFLKQNRQFKLFGNKDLSYIKRNLLNNNIKIRTDE